MNIDFARKLELAYHQQCKNLCNEFHLKQTGFDILMFLGNNPQYKHAKDIVEIRKIKANLVSIHVDFFSSLFSDIDEKHQKIFKETLELMEKNIDCLLEEK